MRTDLGSLSHGFKQDGKRFCEKIEILVCVRETGGGRGDKRQNKNFGDSWNHKCHN